MLRFARTLYCEAHASGMHEFAGSSTVARPLLESKTLPRVEAGPSAWGATLAHHATLATSAFVSAACAVGAVASSSDAAFATAASPKAIPAATFAFAATSFA
jgi:hypothetical protein